MCAVVLNVIDSPGTTEPAPNAVAMHLAVGFLLVGLVLTASGLFLSRTLAWSLAGLSGWAASIVLQNRIAPRASLALQCPSAGARCILPGNS